MSRQSRAEVAKYEARDYEAEEWWLNRFKEMEKEHFKVNHRRGSVVHDVVPNPYTFRLIAPMLGVDVPPSRDVDTSRVHWASDDHVVEAEVAADTSDEEVAREKSEESDTDDVTSSETDAEPDSLSVEPPSCNDEKDQCEEYTNPYLEFMKRPRERAAIWRPRPKLKPTEMFKTDPNFTLLEKADEVTKKLCVDFCKWTRTLGGMDQQNLDEQDLDELFQIEFAQPAAGALRVRVRELLTLPAEIAEERCNLEADCRFALRKMIDDDILAEKSKPQPPFNTLLRHADRVVEPRKKREPWLGVKAPWELTTFKTAWEGTLHLESTRGFCRYLLNHPELRRPAFLRTSGMFDPIQLGPDEVVDSPSCAAVPVGATQRASVT